MRGQEAVTASKGDSLEGCGSAPQTSTGGVACPSSGIPTVTVAGQRWTFTRLPLNERL